MDGRQLALLNKPALAMLVSRLEWAPAAHVVWWPRRWEMLREGSLRKNTEPGVSYQSLLLLRQHDHMVLHFSLSFPIDFELLVLESESDKALRLLEFSRSVAGVLGCRYGMA